MFHTTRRAMATEFAAWLVGGDDEQLSAAAEAMWEEIERVERLLSRFDPAGEVGRVNREAIFRPVLVSRELAEVLAICHEGWQRTEGYFDPSLRPSADTAPQGWDAQIEFDRDRRTIRFTAPGVRLDFGAFGKGYALDRADECLQNAGVTSFLLHGGTSSILARGTDAWRVALRDPFAVVPDAVLPSDDDLSLHESALSISAAFDPGAGGSDIIDPLTGRPQQEQAACIILAPRAAEAEILSTALLAMGRERAQAWWNCQPPDSVDAVRVGWIELPGVPRVTWSSRAAGPGDIAGRRSGR